MERPHENNRYDPLADIDHAAVCRTFRERIIGRAQDYIQLEYDRQVAADREVFKLYEKIALYLREIENGEYTEMGTRARAFKSGSVLALSVIEHLVTKLGIDIDVFYEEWQILGGASLVDAHNEKYAALTNDEKLHMLGKSILHIGQSSLFKLPDDYMDIVVDAMNQEENLQEEEVAFSAGYGYVMGFGYAAVQYLYEKAKLGVADLDNELRQLAVVELDKNVPSHESIAETLLLLLEDDEVPVEEVLGEIVASNLADHEGAVETLNAFSVAVYPNEFGNFSLDDVGEACFNGANLGFYVGIELYRPGSNNIHECVDRWKGVRLHKMLQENGPDYFNHTRNDSRRILSDVLQSSDIPEVYTEVFAAIDVRLGFDADEAVAFRNGFHYALQTVEKQVEGQKKAKVSVETAEVMKHYEASEGKFMREHDITGSLQEVYTAYLGHCAAMSLNPDAMSEAEAETLLERTLNDYDRLMPEMKEIAVEGPCIIHVVDLDDTEAVDVVLLDKGERVCGTIHGFRISPFPSDKSYADENVHEIGQFPMCIMPALIIKDTSVLLEGSEAGRPGGDIVIGFAIPGAKYRRA